ncbi:hypothetical protein RFI_07804 [Reticulomyxa filosa]|uniref:FDX-ACB domain-containing protein n=1 Tax=Reticulomyxa filosa TaxID=46433 RepID=X6NSQ4_RETFI|nr:hypothetical protein RFI_07804 [Reticulomyxa filosa]|eukprot:ETO29320.1 hypothetical protein RFI_07804 [Reticulomyxa filosa]
MFPTWLFNAVSPYLGDIFLLSTCSKVCKYWREVGKDLSVWSKKDKDIKQHKHRPKSTLIIGDGDFSFTYSYIQLLPRNRLSCELCDKSDKKREESEYRAIVTSTYCENEKDLLKLHPGALENINILKSKEYESWIHILYNVDCTNMEKTLVPQIKNKIESFDQIIFNFPHHPVSGKIQLNRLLCKQLFENINRCNIMNEKSEVIIRLCFGQGGTLFEYEFANEIRTRFLQKMKYNQKMSLPIYDQLPSTERYFFNHKSKKTSQQIFQNSWQIVHSSAYGDMKCVQIRPFHLFVQDIYPYYQCTGRKNKNQPFILHCSFTYVFMKQSIQNQFIPSLFPPSFFRDISFYILEPSSDHNNDSHNDGNNDPITKSKHIRQSLPNYIFQSLPFSKDVITNVEFLNDFLHPTTKLLSQTWRIWYQSDTTALTKEKVNHYQMLLRDALRRDFNVGVGSLPISQD